MDIRIYKAILHTGNKTKGAILKKSNEVYFSNSEIEKILAYYNQVNNAIVYVIEELGSEDYSLVGWVDECNEQIPVLKFTGFHKNECMYFSIYTHSKQRKQRS